MVSFERESRWIRVNGILPESLGESDSRPSSDPVLHNIFKDPNPISIEHLVVTMNIFWSSKTINTVKQEFVTSFNT